MKEPRSGRDQGILGNTGKSTEPIFDPLGYFMVRAPLFPIEIFRALHTLTTDSSNEHLINSPRVLQAIAVGSLSLLDEIERQTNSQRDKITSVLAN